jgi:thymidylate kinase
MHGMDIRKGGARGKEYLMIVHPMLEAVFRAFEQEGVCWCVLRGEANLAAPPGDVDLLVAPADLGRVRTVLEAHQFAPVSYSGRDSHSLFVGYHPHTETWIMLDIVTELAYGPFLDIQTHAAAGCLARRQRIGALYVLAPEDAFWTLLLHCIIDKGTFAHRHAVRLQELVDGAHTDSPLAQQITSACPPGWNAVRLVAGVKQGDWSVLTRLAPTLAAGWRRSESIDARWRALTNRALQFPARALARLRRRGVSVALLGPDGAGKSTLVAGIKRSFYLPVRSIYIGVWPYSPAHSVPMVRSRLPVVCLAGRLLSAATHPPRIWWRYLTAQYHQTLGRAVIFDRYAYDGLLYTRQSVGWLKWLYLQFVIHAFPAPDLVFVLDAPGEVVYARKGEETPEAMETTRQGLLALRHRIRQLQVVDATRSEAAVRVDVVGRIWSEYCARWSKSGG